MTTLAPPPATRSQAGLAAALCKRNRKTEAPEGMSRLHALCLNIAGVKQLVVVVRHAALPPSHAACQSVNKMDAVGYRQEVFREVEAEVRSTLTKIGYQAPPPPSPHAPLQLAEAVGRERRARAARQRLDGRQPHRQEPQHALVDRLPGERPRS
jgi:hypothetical protein